jgi:hypothetical protein
LPDVFDAMYSSFTYSIIALTSPSNSSRADFTPAANTPPNAQINANTKHYFIITSNEMNSGALNICSSSISSILLVGGGFYKI